MDSKQDIELKIIFSRSFFYIGEPISGKIKLKTGAPAIIDKIIVYIDLFQGFNYNKNAPFYSSENIANCELDLNSVPTINRIQGSYVLPGGENIIPFKIKIKKEMQPIFEYPLGDIFSFIRYIFKIKLFSNSFYKLDWNRYILIYSYPSAENRQKCFTKSISKSLKKWGLKDIGTTDLTVSIPDDNFRYDDTKSKIIIHINNTHGRASTKESIVKIIRTIEFFDEKGSVKYKQEKEIFSQNLATNVGPGQQNYFECFLSFREFDVSKYNYDEKQNKSPYGYLMKSVNFLMPTVLTKYISCKYELSVTLNFDCLVSESKLPKISFPIYMIQNNLMQYQIDKQNLEEEEEKSQKSLEKKEKNIDNNIINNIKIENKINDFNNNKIQKFNKDLNNIYTNNQGNSINNNNFNYNFNISINNNMNNLNNNIISENKNKSIKESTFTIFDDETNFKPEENPIPTTQGDFIDINAL